jgi:hypothetical protein
MSVADFDRYYAGLSDRNDRIEAGRPQIYGDPSITGLRAFLRYHKDARQDFVINGRMRSLTRNQVVMHGLVARVATTHEHATVTSLAKEAHVAPSTVSRFMLKLQAWGEYAIDVTRGRNGGVTIRLRTMGDNLKAYAERAWARIRKTAEKAFLRSAGNVASTIPRKGEGLTGNYLVMDATFKDPIDWEALLEDARRRWLR